MNTYFCVTVHSTFEIEADNVIISTHGVIFNASKKIVGYIPHDKLVSFAEKTSIKKTSIKKS